MGLELGNLLGAAANLTTALSKDKDYKSFLDIYNQFGIQVANNFEVNFSGLEDITFYVQSVNFGGVQGDSTEVYYDGKAIPLYYQYQYEHDGSLTILDDAQGYLHAALVEFMASDSSSKLANSGYTMTIKALTGDSKYKGSVITIRGVKIKSVSGLTFGQDSNNIITFDVGFSYIDFSSTPGGLAKAAGVVGAVNSLLGGVY